MSLLIKPLLPFDDKVDKFLKRICFAQFYRRNLFIALVKNSILYTINATNEKAVTTVKIV